VIVDVDSPSSLYVETNVASESESVEVTVVEVYPVESVVETISLSD